MPLQSDACTPIAEQRCSVLWQIADYLLCKTYEAVGSCFAGACCDGQISAYVTTGQGDDGIVDQLTVSLLQIDPSVLTASIGPGLYRATFLVRLHESGWPTARVDGDTVIPPAPEEQARAIQQLMAHGEAMHRRLTHLRASGQILPPGMNPPRLNSAIGQLAPVFPQGGVAGWTILVTIDLPWGM